MRNMLPLVVLVLASACASSSPSGSAAPPDGGVTDAPTASDARVLTCGTLGDAGFTRLEDMPVRSYCGPNKGLSRWSTECHGSIVVVYSEGTDCSSYWLFDATTHALQATAHGCNLQQECTGGVSGFSLPLDCFEGLSDGSFKTDVIPLCPDAG